MKMNVGGETMKRSRSSSHKMARMTQSRRGDPMKRIVTCLIVGVMLLSFIVGYASSLAAKEPIILQGVTMDAPDTELMELVHVFVDRVNAEAKGELRIKWLGGPEVIPAFDSPEAVRKGTIQIDIYNSNRYYTGMMPEGDIGPLTLLTPWEERKSGAYDLWDQIFQKKANVKYLGRIHSLCRSNIYVNTRVEKLKDLKGLIIRGSKLYGRIMEQFGASGVNMPLTDLYTSMDRKVINGFITSIGMLDLGLHEVTKYMIEPGFFTLDAVTTVNLDTWNKIPKHLQDLMIKIMKEFEHVGYEWIQDNKAKEKQKMIASGMEILTLPPDDAKKFLEVAHRIAWQTALERAPEYGPKLKELIYDYKMK